MIVLDASAAVHLLVDVSLDQGLASLVASEELHAPSLIDYEVTSALRGHSLGGLITDRRLDEALADYLALDIQRRPMTALLPDVLDVRRNFTAYDASYVVLARALGAPLVTTDAKLAEAHRLGVDVKIFAGT